MRTSTRLRQLAPLAALLVGLAAASCGGDGDKDPTGPGPSGTDPYYLRGTINGAAWSAPGLPIGVTHATPGQYVLIAEPAGSYRLSIVLWNITGPGTYALGVGAQTRGGTVTLSLQPATWVAPNSGSAGSMTFTTLNDTLMVGTFNFTANEVGGASTRTLTAGEFRLRVVTLGTVGPVPDNAWSEVRATINGAAWNAAAVAPSYANNTLGIAAFNDTRTLTLVFSQVDGPGEYHLSTAIPIRTMTVVGDGTDPNVCCWGGYETATATLIVDSITSTRIVGSLHASLEPSPFGGATGTVEIVGGTFSIGLINAP